MKDGLLMMIAPTSEDEGRSSEILFSRSEDERRCADDDCPHLLG
jgi:hypothetical protein